MKKIILIIAALASLTAILSNNFKSYLETKTLTRNEAINEVLKLK